MTADVSQDRETTRGRPGAVRGAAQQTGGMLWFAGWLFTIGYAPLVWWKIPLGIVIWPYLLGAALR